MLTDVKIPLAIADAASIYIGVLIVSSINVGCSPYFLDFPGTFSVQITTLMDYVEDILKSVFHQGFRCFYFFNGHIGSDPLGARLFELCNELKVSQVEWYSWWLSNSIKQNALEHQITPTHANKLEAFPFTRVSELPQNEKTLS